MSDKFDLREKYNPSKMRFDSRVADEEALGVAMEGVTPLASRGKVVESRLPSIPDTPPSQPTDQGTLMAREEAGWELIPDYIQGGARISDRRLLKKLQSGGFSVQARIDLHGLTIEEAREDLFRFLRRCILDGQRCALVIHGRGLHSANGVAVLRSKVQEWFKSRRFAQVVQLYATALPKDGGLGATYVLLAKQSVR